MPHSFDSRLAKLATLSIHSGLGLLPGQEMLLVADISAAPLVRLLQQEAYKAGAKNVFVMYSDEIASLVRYQNASDEAIAYAPEWYFRAVAGMLETGGAYMWVTGGDPGLLKSVDPSRIAISSKAQATASEAMRNVVMSGNKINWCGVSYATPAWAKIVFPDLPESEAVSKLWDAIFATTRVDTEDPTQAWRDHADQLEFRAELLNSKKYDAVRFTGPGTNLTVGLADDHLWGAARLRPTNGSVCIPNLPTEEVFTMPHRDRVNGVVRSTKPLSVRGTLIDGIEVEFVDGKAVKATASKGEEQLNRLIDTDAGARFLGEVALVPNSSAVSQTDLLFFNTLFDENAACHIALGQAYAENLAGVEALSEEAKRAKGMNESLIHVDWMIGSGEVDVDGITKSGIAEPLMRAGEWV